MELVVRKNDLLRELQLYQGIVERKSTIPVLANVLMEARGEEVGFLATDLEVALRSRCAASVSRPGSLTVPAKKMFEIVKALPETDVRIREDKNGVKVAADRFDSRIQTLPREDFPTVPEPSGAGSVALPGAQLREMVEKILFAMTSEDTRYYLNGALFVLKGAEIALVATDGHRLAHVSLARPAEAAPLEESRVILPKKTVWELGRLLAEADGEVRYERGENHIFFTIGTRVLISRMIEGQFPAYERVIPRGNDRRVEFERERITNAIRRVALLSNERSRAIKFGITKEGVEVSSNSADVGEATEVVAAEYGGAPLEICFNAQYVQDFLNVVKTDAVAMELKDEVSQAVMRPVGSADHEYTYVLMPMRV